jgi:hypothetical protein
MKKTPVGAGTFCPSPTLVFYNPPCQKMPYNLWRKTFSLLLTGNSVKASKQKMSGKTAGYFHRMGRGNPGLRHFQQTQ